MKKCYLLLCAMALFTSGTVSAQKPTLDNGKNIQVPINAKDAKRQTCRENIHFWEKKYKSETTTTKLDEKFIFFDPDPIKISSSISKIFYEKPNLHVVFESQALHEEKSGYIYKLTEKQVYEGSPVGTALSTVILLGLPLLFNPLDTLGRAIGCTDEIVIKQWVPINTSTTTGKVETRSIDLSHQIKLVGLGLDKIFYVTPKENPGIKSATIDLTEWVLESSSTGTSSLEIQCLSCKTDTQDDRRIQTSSPLSLSINADLLALRNDVLVERKRIEDALLAEKVRLGILERERLERALAEEKRIESEQRAELARRKQAEQNELIRKKEIEKKRQVREL